MSDDNALWLGGVIWLGLGVAHDALVLTLGGIALFLAHIHRNRTRNRDR